MNPFTYFLNQSSTKILQKFYFCQKWEILYFPAYEMSSEFLENSCCKIEFFKKWHRIQMRKTKGCDYSVDIPLWILQ